MPLTDGQVCWAAPSGRSGYSWGERWKSWLTCGWLKHSKPWLSSIQGQFVLQPLDVHQVVSHNGFYSWWCMMCYYDLRPPYPHHLWVHWIIVATIACVVYDFINCSERNARFFFLSKEWSTSYSSLFSILSSKYTYLSKFKKRWLKILSRIIPLLRVV